ncbi:hypothetical protein C0989_002859 [Termitomyces sp. Mn162]|nr:hypothetical protein C0989_002859 [Termitomyces sp. Mn162]
MTNDTTKVTSMTSNTPPVSVLTSAAKPANKGKAPERSVANEPSPVTKKSVKQSLVHLFSGIPGCYTPPANQNFAAPDQANNSAYQTMPPIYNIEQSKAVFERVLSTKVTVSVGKLCSVSQDIRNQLRTAITPKQLAGTNTNTVQDPSNIFEAVLLLFAMDEPHILLGSNVTTANGLTTDCQGMSYSLSVLFSLLMVLLYSPLLSLSAGSSPSPQAAPVSVCNSDKCLPFHMASDQTLGLFPAFQDYHSFEASHL